MKSLLSVGVIALALFSVNTEAQQRRAARAQVIIGAELLNAQIGSDRTQRAVDGSIVIDVTGRQARLVLQRENRGRPAPFSVTLPVTSITRNACNVITYVATRRAGATTQTLTVRDKIEELDRCRVRGEQVYTEVEFTVADGSRDQAPQAQKFTAARLSRQAPIFIADEGK